MKPGAQLQKVFNCGALTVVRQLRMQMGLHPKDLWEPMLAQVLGNHADICSCQRRSLIESPQTRGIAVALCGKVLCQEDVWWAGKGGTPLPHNALWVRMRRHCPLTPQTTTERAVQNYKASSTGPGTPASSCTVHHVDLSWRWASSCCSWRAIGACHGRYLPGGSRAPTKELTLYVA